MNSHSNFAPRLIPARAAAASQSSYCATVAASVKALADKPKLDGWSSVIFVLPKVKGVNVKSA